MGRSMRPKFYRSRIDTRPFGGPNMGAVAEAIRHKLGAAFSPTRLDVVDESDRHKGHEGAREGGESHFNVTVESAAFAGVGKVQRQRMIYAALAEELAGPVH